MTSQLVLEALPLLPKFFTEGELIYAIHLARKQRPRPTEPYPEGLAIKAEVLGKLRPTLPELVSEYKVSKLAVFGSVPKGTASEDSDVDVYLEVAEGQNYLYLIDYLEKLLEKKVDVVTKGFSNKDVLNTIHETAEFLR
jgi:uncharacterized protein